MTAFLEVFYFLEIGGPNKWSYLEVMPCLHIEIYISQRNNWPYLSTMRIIRAFRNQAIPVNIGTYKSSNYEILNSTKKS